MFLTIVLLGAGREVVSKTSAYNISKLSYSVVLNCACCIYSSRKAANKSINQFYIKLIPVINWKIKVIFVSVYFLKENKELKSKTEKAVSKNVMTALLLWIVIIFII